MRKLDETVQRGRARIEGCRPGIDMRDVFEAPRQRLHQFLLRCRRTQENTWLIHLFLTRRSDCRRPGCHGVSTTLDAQAVGRLAHRHGARLAVDPCAGRVRPRVDCTAASVWRNTGWLEAQSVV